jgi:hypothetical protein
MMWAALYQQRPAPDEGEYFKAAWLKPYVSAPATETLAIYGASDYAVTADAQNEADPGTCPGSALDGYHWP